MGKMWDGRFKKGESSLMERFNESISFDRRLYREDIIGSIAYSKALKKYGILTEEEQKKIEEGLLSILDEIDRGEFVFDIKDEDIHMAIEKRLTELIGDVGKKLHTGRSRNDQVAIDVRLYLKKEIKEVKRLIVSLLKSFYNLAKNNIKTYLPGYTHLQQAQIISFSHYILNFFFAIKRDLERLIDLEKRVDIMPLGSGAIAGNAFEIDREFLKNELGFMNISPNSIDAISDRDFIAEFIFFASELMIHISRLAEDFIIYSTKEFNFIELDDAYSTGSSMMPQKKNPDSLELIRGKTARVIGNLITILTLQKGLPTSYNKDLQEDKEPLFDTIDTIKIVLEVLKNVIDTLKIKKENMLKDIDSFIYATDLADYLVKKGVPFREAHKIIGNIVGYAVDNNIDLWEIPIEKYKEFSPLFEGDLYRIFSPEVSTSLRSIFGGTGEKSIKRQLEIAEEFLKGFEGE